MKPTPPRYWQNLSFARNRILGQLHAARSLATRCQTLPIVSLNDKLLLQSIAFSLNIILDRWDKHFIKNLRQETLKKDSTNEKS